MIVIILAVAIALIYILFLFVIPRKITTDRDSLFQELSMKYGLQVTTNPQQEIQSGTIVMRCLEGTLNGKTVSIMDRYSSFFYRPTFLKFFYGSEEGAKKWLQNNTMPSRFGGAQTTSYIEGHAQAIKPTFMAVSSFASKEQIESLLDKI